MDDKGERIYLLEVFVDNLHLENCKSNNELVKTCVRFKLLNYPFLEIMEDEYCKVPNEACDIKFQSGKSCLFSLKKPPTGSKKPPLNLQVNVIRMEQSSTSMEVGKTTINLSGSFTNLMNTEQANQENTRPLSKVARDTYNILNSKNQVVGNITVLVRLSCFGKMIVTQFQMSGMESKSCLFKAVSDIRGKKFEGSGDGDPMKSAGFSSRTSVAADRAKSQSSMSRNKGTQRNQSESQLQIIHPNQNEQRCQNQMMYSNQMGYQNQMGYPNQMGYQNQMGYPGQMGPSNQSGCPGQMKNPGMGQPGQMSFPYQQPMGPSYQQPVGQPPQDGPPPSGLDYKTFSATVNGHTLNIQVLRKPKKLKQPEAILCKNICQVESSSESDEDEDEISKRKHDEQERNERAEKMKQLTEQFNLCSCDIPIPPGMYPPPEPVNKKNDEKDKKKKKKKKKSKMVCPMDDGMYCRGECPLGFPTPPGMVRPNYTPLTTTGAVPNASGEPQNFLISMKPRAEFPVIMPPVIPRCTTVRDTQYEETDVKGASSAKGGKADKKGKPDKGGKKKGKK